MERLRTTSVSRGVGLTPLELEIVGFVHGPSRVAPFQVRPGGRPGGPHPSDGGPAPRASRNPAPDLVEERGAGVWIHRQVTGEGHEQIEVRRHVVHHLPVEVIFRHRLEAVGDREIDARQLTGSAEVPAVGLGQSEALVARLDLDKERIATVGEDVGGRPQRQMTVRPQEAVGLLVACRLLDPVPGRGRDDGVVTAVGPCAAGPTLEGGVDHRDPTGPSTVQIHLGRRRQLGRQLDCGHLPTSGHHLLGGHAGGRTDLHDAGARTEPRHLGQAVEQASRVPGTGPVVPIGGQLEYRSTIGSTAARHDPAPSGDTCDSAVQPSDGGSLMEHDHTQHDHLELGAFSISLTVADLQASLAFYEKLGFEVTGGDADQGWLILVNGSTVIGLFQGMFDRNMLTFNPGWVVGGDHPDEFTDVREIQARLEAAGLELQDRVAADNGDGPAHITLVDPDGNPILIDQHR